MPATPAMLDAGFISGKKEIGVLIAKLVPSWAMGMVNITDVEIHAVTDIVVQAAERQRALDIARHPQPTAAPAPQS